MADRVEVALQRLAGDLQEALGERLVSLVLYGSRARGSHLEGRSDANLLLVVRDASPAALRAAWPALARWAGAGFAPPLIHSQAEWTAASDVYPLEVEDIREAHRVLAGSDPVSDLVTRRADQVRELEHQARGMLLHLRGRYAALAGDGRALGGLLAASVGTFLVFCRAVLRLAGRAVPAGSEAVVTAAAEVAGFDPEPVIWAARARGEKRPRLGPDDPRGEAFLVAVARLVQWVDGQ